MSVQYKVCPSKFAIESKEPSLYIADDEYLGQRARFALGMIERWGMVAGVPGGEDSAGRAKLQLMPESDLVARACKATELAFAEFSKRGWITDLPSIETMTDMVKNKEVNPA